MSTKTTHRILIVDDEDDILVSLQDLLETSLDNVEVLTAPNADQGMEEVRGGNLDLIISDYKMPGKNGLEFLADCEQEAPNVPRIIITAFPDLDVALKAINKAAITNFFTKPFDADEVVEVVQNNLRNRRRAVQRDQAFARAMGMRRQEGE